MNTATEKQVAFIARLKTEAMHTEEATEALEMAYTLWGMGAFDKAAASALIEVLLATPKVKAEVEYPPEGMHKVGNEVYKVQRAVHGSGELYAKRLVLGRPDEVTGVSTATFVYAPGAARALTKATLMSLDEAKKWGLLYGSCIRCGRTLTDESSIAAGIGPVCAGKWNA